MQQSRLDRILLGLGMTDSSTCRRLASLLLGAATLTAPAAFTGWLAASHASAADAIFKKIEPDGSVTFTDQPLEDAELTTGSPISVVDGPAAPLTAPDTVPAPVAAAPTVEGVKILLPLDGDTLIDQGQPLRVDVITRPPIDPNANHGLLTELLLDGAPLTRGAAGALQAAMPDRGTHTLQARVQSAQGRTLAESEVVTVHVRKPGAL